LTDFSLALKLVQHLQSIFLVQHMMKQCIFMIFFSLGAHGIRLQPSRQSLQKLPNIEPKSINDEKMASGGPYAWDQIINICSLGWGLNVDQPVQMAAWYSDEIQLLKFQDPLLSAAGNNVVVSLKEKTSREESWNDDCKEYWQTKRSETASPIYPTAAEAAADGYTPTGGSGSIFFAVSCDAGFYKSQTAVRGLINDWQHNNYGGSFRIPPWMYVCAGMTALGDPHVVNILGETFDIISQGEVELVRYPKGADDSSSKLIITASIAKLGQKCHDTYMKNITVSGAWLKEAISFKDDEDNGNVLVSQGSDAGLAPVEFHRMNESHTVRLDNKRIHFLNPKRVSLTVAGVTQVVVYTSGRPHQGVGTYLNLDLQGFTTLEGEVGGLLGQDSHKKELDLAKETCSKSSVAKSRAFHQKANEVPLHEEDRLFHVRMQ